MEQGDYGRQTKIQTCIKVSPYITNSNHSAQHTAALFLKQMIIDFTVAHFVLKKSYPRIYYFIFLHRASFLSFPFLSFPSFLPSFLIFSFYCFYRSKVIFSPSSFSLFLFLVFLSIQSNIFSFLIFSFYCFYRSKVIFSPSSFSLFLFLVFLSIQSNIFCIYFAGQT